jgi:formylglycine-generating enzyme required for sulfatase activity
VSTEGFEVRLPPRIELERSGAPGVEIGAMRRVAGDVHYIFGGRVQAEEQRTWQEYFGRGHEYTRRSLVEDVAVPDFYLDETEVTVEQYRGFLRASDGYAAVGNWHGAAPPAERRLELLERLASVDGELPVTGVTLEEARAYATWVGKRLPTLIEWEYVVRGGDAYRPYSCAVKGQELDASQFNVDLRIEGDRTAWPVREGCDVTPEGVRNLCSNVSEWTAPTEQGRAYAAGASFESIGSNVHAFYSAVPRPAGTTLASLGFRCALGSRDAEGMLVGAEGGPIRARRGGR